MREVTTSRSDGYWFRLVDNGFEWVYSWGTGDMRYIYRASLEYLGRGKYRLSGRTCNGAVMPYNAKNSVKFSRRDRRRTPGYKYTIDLIDRMIEK